MSANMESYRPFFKHEKEMHRLKHEPKMYEYVPLPGLDRLLRGETGLQPVQPEAKVSAAAIFLRALLASIIDLPDILAGAYDEGGKIETPRSTIAKS